MAGAAEADKGQSKTRPEPLATLHVNDLIGAYANDGATAAARYTDKILQLDGVPAYLYTDGKGRKLLSTAQSFDSVHLRTVLLYIDPSCAATFASLSPKEPGNLITGENVKTVSVRGLCKGKQGPTDHWGSFSLVIEGCTLVKD